jgi:hypothetical protein
MEGRKSGVPKGQTKHSLLSARKVAPFARALSSLSRQFPEIRPEKSAFAPGITGIIIVERSVLKRDEKEAPRDGVT